jgi:hypothetical protein
LLAVATVAKPWSRKFIHRLVTVATVAGVTVATRSDCVWLGVADNQMIVMGVQHKITGKGGATCGNNL